MKEDLHQAAFAAGCFWGVEAAFREIQGVADVEAGYTGGSVANPTYEQVCTGKTGHAEAVRVTYNPQKVSYEELLDLFWKIHDPTQLNRQGLDIGEQYRSAIFYQTPEQEQIARVSKEELEKSGMYEGDVVTAIEPAGPFYRAEEYHQQYLAKRNRRVC